MSNQSGNRLLGGEEMQNKQEPPGRYYLGSVLLADRIEEFVRTGWLIVPDPQTDAPDYKEIGLTFDKKQLRRAKYDVRLGKKYYKADDYHDLSEGEPDLIVEPYELVFVESYEVFNLPRNVVAKYDLRVSGCLEGMGLQTGLQLDPTYYGRFFCPLFNFSDTMFKLTYKQQLASVQFIYTTPSTPEAEAYPPFEHNKGGLFSLRDALPKYPRGSGLGKLWEDIKEAKAEIEQWRTEIKAELEQGRNETRSANIIFLAVVGLILTVFGAIQIPAAIGSVGGTSLWTVGIIGAVAIVIVAMLLCFIKSLFKRDHPGSSREKEKQ